MICEDTKDLTLSILAIVTMLLVADNIWLHCKCSSQHDEIAVLGQKFELHVNPPPRPPMGARKTEAGRIAEERHKAEEARVATENAESERRARDAEKVRKLQEEVARLKETAKSVREEPATRTVPTSDRTRRKFDGTPTMTLLKFSSKEARSYYEKAAESAREGAHNKAKVKADYEKGRECGGPVWPELEAWLEWWK